jgi:hypothetical protein
MGPALLVVLEAAEAAADGGGVAGVSGVFVSSAAASAAVLLGEVAAPACGDCGDDDVFDFVSAACDDRGTDDNDVGDGAELSSGGGMLSLRFATFAVDDRACGLEVSSAATNVDDSAAAGGSDSAIIICFCSIVTKYQKSMHPTKSSMKLLFLALFFVHLLYFRFSILSLLNGSATARKKKKTTIILSCFLFW